MASVKASALKQQLRSQFLNSNTRSITEEHTRIAEEYLQELRREQGDGYKLTLDLINLEHLLRLNNYNHSTIILAFEVLLSKYIVNLLQRQLPHKWWSLNTRNPQFSHRIKVMEGWMEIMKVVGYSEAGDAGALTFPPDQRIAPDRSKIGLIAAELLITKTDLKNHPISYRSFSSPYTPPLEQRVRPTPKPRARTMVQLAKEGDSITDTINESMGFSTAKFQQPLSVSQESSYYASVGRSFQAPHWDEDRSVADELRESREDEVEVLRHNEYTHAPNVYSETASITNEDDEDDDEGKEEGDDEDNQLKKLRKVLSDMKKVRVSTGTNSAPLLNLSTTKQPPQQIPPSLQPNSSSKQRKAPPVPKKRTVFLQLATSEGESSRPALSTITEDDRAEHTIKPSSHERQTCTTQVPTVSHLSTIHEVPPTQSKPLHSGQLSTEQAAATSSSSSPSLPVKNSPSTPSQEAKNAAEVEHFKQFTPEKQREYLDAKQYHNESILHLIPHFKGVMPKDPVPVFASDSDLEEERRKKKMEEDGLYLLNCIKQCVPLGFAPEEVAIAVSLIRHKQKGPLDTQEALDYLSRDWLRKVEDTQIHVERMRGDRGAYVGKPSMNEVRRCLIQTQGDIEMAANACFRTRQHKIGELLYKFQGKLHVSWDMAIRGLSYSNLSVEQAYYTIQCWGLEPLYDFLYEGKILPMDLDQIKAHVLEGCKEKDREDYQAVLRMIMAECRLPTKKKAELLVQLLEHKDEYPMRYYIDAANNHADFEAACKFLNQPCPICVDEFLMDDMITMPYCNHSVCRDCFKQHFTLTIKEKSVKHFTCPICSEPDMMMRDQTQDFYLELFVALIKLNLDRDQYVLCQQKLTDFNLSREPGFIWCTNQECKSGFIVEQQDLQNRYEVRCPHCQSPMCFQCRKTWEDQHKGISCEQFAKWKTDNDPEAQKAGLAAHLNENGIQCPVCKYRYDLARGGCMHFRCTQCPNEFCSGCGSSIKNGAACGKFESCKNKGLHGHHPRDCLYYLRDFNVAQLQKLLKDNNIEFDIEPPEAQVEAVRAAKEQKAEGDDVAGGNGEVVDAAGGEADAGEGAGEVKLHCCVMLQKETPNGLIDEECKIPSPDGMAGLCSTHYKEYLVNKINKNKLDPLELYDNIAQILCREEKQVPPKEEESDEDYRQKLIEYIKQELPLHRENPELM